MMSSCKQLDFYYDEKENNGQDNYGQEVSSYRRRMKEPAMLMPKERLSRMGVEYYSGDKELPSNMDEKIVKNTTSTPSQVVAVSTSTTSATQQKEEGKGQRNLVYVVAAAVVAYFAMNQME